MFGGGTLKNAIPTLKFPKSTLFRLFRVAPPSVPSNTHKNYDSPYNMIALVINDLIVLAKPGGTVEFLNVEFNVGTMYIRCTFDVHLHSSTHIIIFMYSANTGKEETNLILSSIT